MDLLFAELSDCSGWWERDASSDIESEQSKSHVQPSANQGAQDTLLDNMGTHYFLKCRIIGKVDFIYGSAKSLSEILRVIKLIVTDCFGSRYVRVFDCGSPSSLCITKCPFSVWIINFLYRHGISKLLKRPDGELLKHMDKQNEVFMETYRSMLHELQNSLGKTDAISEKKHEE
ncbi:hypothetical protein Fmac_009470 [Flemingia macrophylla]|uniref:Uncharacterized protein n=1 Tax=Flemingia macrophylla TaxID=520843 RepID=A0ABD1N0C7_9FABA